VTLSAGARVGSFELLGPLGAGGMGEVYRARDTRLGRDAAIKVLPAELAGDADRRARFEQEARAASALNHPNILTVYDIGTVDGSLFIAMEYVDGKTLREVLASGTLPTRRLLPIACQIADGLAKAHSAGIVHRDLKPENVMVNKDGFAKILDFGLAKLAAAPEEGGSQLQTLVGPGTRPGVVLGTVGYMSPEQASGAAVDFRSDQFSLGSILYEMATGKRAFQKKTAVETLSAIIREDPEPIAAVDPTAPAPLRWIVDRCLAKEPEDRYASTRDLARDLKQTQERLSDATGEAAVPGARRPGRRRWWAAGLAALALLAAADLALRLRSGGAASATAPALSRVTFGPGLEDEPSFSPDGKFLAYTTDERGNLDVLVQPLGGGEPIRIGYPDADDGEPAWSPDGSKLAFVSAREHGGRLGIALNVGPLEPYLNAKFGDIFLVPALGGTPVKLVEDGYFPSWSPDGKRIVFMSNRDRQLNLWTVSAGGGAPARLTKNPDIDYQPAWSPDGKWIAYGSGVASTSFEVRVVAASGGTPRTLTADFGYVTRPAWSADGKTLFFSGERAGILNVWRVPFSEAGKPVPPSRVTLGQGQDTGVALSHDGKRLAFAADHNDSNIWELTVDTGQLRAVTSGASQPDYPQPSPDGKTLLVTATRTGESAIWTVDLQGRFLSQLTTGFVGQPSAHWSPDGRWIAYLREGKGGGLTLWLLPIGSMNAQDTGVPASVSEWSPDGKWIATGVSQGRGEITVYSVDKKTALPVTSVKSEVDDPTWSPDGKQIAFRLERGPIREIWVVPAHGGQARPLTKDQEDSHPAWNPANPDEILFLRDHKRLAILSVSTGKVRFLPGYAEGSYVLDYPSWSRDGKRIYFTVARKSGDVYLLEGF
jgi:Tol biopolymer transport system component/predicted Ser/Thr protein kinase